MVPLQEYSRILRARKGSVEEYQENSKE